MPERIGYLGNFVDAFNEARDQFEQLFLSSVEYQRIEGWSDLWRQSLSTLREQVGSLPSDARIDDALQGVAAAGALLALSDTIRSHFGSEVEPCRD